MSAGFNSEAAHSPRFSEGSLRGSIHRLPLEMNRFSRQLPIVAALWVRASSYRSGVGALRPVIEEDRHVQGISRRPAADFGHRLAPAAGLAYRFARSPNLSRSDGERALAGAIRGR